MDISAAVRHGTVAAVHLVAYRAGRARRGRAPDSERRGYLMGASWATAVDVIASPGEAFARLREKPTFLFPLLILMALNAGVVFWYYSLVDLAWMLEQQMQAAVPEGQPPAALESSAARTVVGTVAAVAAAGLFALALVVAAAYFAFVSMLTNDGYAFKSWFALVCWCSLPLVLTQLATIVNLIVSDVSHMLPQQLSPLSFANLLGVEPDTAAGGQTFLNLSPILLWSLVLTVLGYHSWTRRSVLASSAIVLGPLLVIFGLVFVLSQA